MMLQSMKVSLNGIPILDSVQIFLLLSNGKLAFGVGEQENAHLENKKFAMKTLRGENKTNEFFK